ncbi:MAG: glycosyltransferase family 4 protein [Akkermansiaceae bacterium]|nr:glycosyltransferase family 4 protein [Akkermansiaceae bacterium]
MRIFTCTPVAFGGGPDFFARDSGLLCRGFQAIGCESMAVMPGERKPEDETDLIRTEFANLESVEWWRSQALDGVVLYAWGRPKFRKVAAAIHQAGIFLVLNQDNGGLVSPLAGFRDWLEEQWILAGQGRGLVAWLGFLKLVLRGLSVGLLLTDPLRAAHLNHGNVIACVSPKAAEHYRKLCQIYGGADLAGRVEVIPHAVESRFRFSGGQKRRQVACVGRWQDVIQKRPWLLMRVIRELVTTDEQVVLVIVGTETPELEMWHRSLPELHRNRVHIQGRVNRQELGKILNESQVFYSPSAYESFGIAAAEALCSGCSVVAKQSVSMASFEWFVTDNSGTLACTDHLQDHVHAIREELYAWENGMRDAETISRIWRERLHAANVAARISRILGVSPTR